MPILASRGLVAPVFAALALVTLTACGRELGADADEGGFGGPTLHNTQVMSGEKDYTIALGQRFAREVPTTITFAFDSAQLTPEAMAVLRRQADWIRQFPEVRFRVDGHTDLVGSAAYNKALGMRRARTTVAYLAAQGISTSRLEAVVSYGKTRPVIQTLGPEQRNRRTVTEVSGFVKNSPALLNGKYAEVIFREYVESATRPHKGTSVLATPGG